MERILDNMENLWAYDVTIPSGTNVADAVMTQGRALVGIQMPAGWDAAKIGFNVSLDNLTYQVAKDNGGNYEQATVAASEYCVFPSTDAIFAPFLQVTSVNASNVAVNQTANRTLTLVFRRFLGGS